MLTPRAARTGEKARGESGRGNIAVLFLAHRVRADLPRGWIICSSCVSIVCLGEWTHSAFCKVLAVVRGALS